MSNASRQPTDNEQDTKTRTEVKVAVIGGVFILIAACIGAVATILAGAWVLTDNSETIPPLQTTSAPSTPPSTLDPTPIQAVDETSIPTMTPYPSSTPTRPPTLTALPPTPTEPSTVRAEFFDDFNKGPNSAWRPLSGSWRVVDGAYTADRSYPQVVYSMVGDIGWRDYAIDVDVTVACQAGYPIVIAVHSLDPGNGVQMHIDCCDIEWLLYYNGESQVIAETDEGIPKCCGGLCWETSHIRIEAQENLYTMYLNGARMLQVYDDTYQYGRAGVGMECSNNCARFDNFEVSELP